jgi:protein-arginine kinase activator protein McsA
MNKICESCHGNGWLVASVQFSSYYPQNHIHIERCDECSKFDSDQSATQHAYAYAKEIMDAVINELNFLEKRIKEKNATMLFE